MAVDPLEAMEQFAVEYKRWMVRRMGAHDHQQLFEILHDIPFVWMADVPLDENREADGRRLRAIFEEDSGLGLPLEWEDWPASFLEVVVAMAETFEDTIMHSPGSDTDSSTWFWMMMENMGIAHCDDAWFRKNQLDGEAFVRGRVDDILLRRYSRSGKGGLFPLKRPHLDQRKTELWYQMNAYALEQGWV